MFLPSVGSNSEDLEFKESITRASVRPYEYDSYYNTRVNRAWPELRYPMLLAMFLIFLGVLAIIFTSVDIGKGASFMPYHENPNYEGVC